MASVTHINNTEQTHAYIIYILVSAILLLSLLYFIYRLIFTIHISYLYKRV